MKQFLLVALSAIVLTTATAHAAIINSMSFNSTTGLPGLASWPSPYIVTSNPTPGVGSTAENNYGGSSLFSLGQSFTATETGKISTVEIAISGTAPVSFSVALYSAGANDVTDIGSGTYTPGSGGYSSNLFSDTSLQTWTGYTTLGANAAILNFALSGADQVPVVAGQAYIFEISATTNPNGMIWYRNGGNPGNYTGGQAYRQRSPLNGNALRDMTIAVNIIPEPSSLVLGGLSMLFITMQRRRS